MGTIKKIGEKCTVCGEGTYQLDYPGRYKIVDQNTGETKDYMRLKCSKCGAKIHCLIISDNARECG